MSTEIETMNDILAQDGELIRVKRATLSSLLCLVLAATGARGVEGAAVAPGDFQEAIIKEGLDKVGIGQGYEIVTADDCDIVENTAAEMMQRLLGRAGLIIPIVAESKSTGDQRILLGRETNLEAIRLLGDKGEVDIRGVSPDDDGFHLKQAGKTIVVAGANPRGVLYGVYAFEDFINNGAEGNLDMRKTPYFRIRASAPGYYWNSYTNMETDDLSAEKVEFFSRLGTNQLSAINVRMIHLWQLVTSDVFPFQPAPLNELQRKIKAASALCGKYGINYFVWLEEPILAGAAEDYPEEALGRVNPPYGDWRQTLCVSSPLVQDHFRQMMRKFAQEYPDVKGVNFYNLDSGTWLCTPALCPRCREICTDSPPESHNPWETQALLVSTLAESALEVRPEFDFRFWGAVHYQDEALDKLLRTTRGYGSLLCCWNAWDRDVMIPDIAELAPGFISSQQACEERKIPVVAVWEMNNLESVPRSLPFPFHVCDAIKKFKNWGIRNINENAGPLPDHNSINALVMKEFLWNPDQSPEEFLSRLAERQFGEKAGKLMYGAWQEIDKAFDVWNDMQFGPLSGSQAYMSIGTPAGVPEAILPEIVKSFDYNVEIRVNVQPWREADYQVFKDKVFLDKMEAMSAHLARAAEYAKNAIDAASDEEYIGTSYYDPENQAPSCRQYAELNYAPIAIAHALSTQRCNILRAYHLLTGIENARAAGDEASAREQESRYLELVREDIEVQEQYCQLLTSFLEMQPCYTRTSLPEGELNAQLSGTKAKIEKLKEYLAAASVSVASGR